MYIAHRGNIEGRIFHLENNPGYLRVALSRGYHVETDVWFERGMFFLGHDKPEFNIDKYFLQDNRVWCHAKDNVVLEQLLLIGAHCFFHNIDDSTLTSRGYIWTFPGRKLTSLSIAVLPEFNSGYSTEDMKHCCGVCSDNIAHYKKILET